MRSLTLDSHKTFFRGHRRSSKVKNHEKFKFRSYRNESDYKSKWRCWDHYIVLTCLRSFQVTQVVIIPAKGQISKKKTYNSYWNIIKKLRLAAAACPLREDFGPYWGRAEALVGWPHFSCAWLFALRLEFFAPRLCHKKLWFESSHGGRA